jgi:hypothetical protein
MLSRVKLTVSSRPSSDKAASGCVKRVVVGVPSPWLAIAMMARKNKLMD